MSPADSSAENINVIADFTANLERTRGAEAAMCYCRASLAIQDHPFLWEKVEVEVLLLGPWPEQQPCLCLPMDPTDLDPDLDPQTDFPA